MDFIGYKTTLPFLDSGGELFLCQGTRKIRFSRHFLHWLRCLEGQVQVKGPFYTKKEAARYCGYAPDTFAKIIREYDLPRYGPKRNRFAQSILDLFMEEPDMFRKMGKTRRTPLQLKVEP